MTGGRFDQIDYLTHVVVSSSHFCFGAVPIGIYRLSVVIEANMGFWPRTTERHVQLS